MDETAFFETQNLLKLYQTKYGEKRIGEITFTLEKGKTLGVVGQSGSGKTTLAKMIVGLEQPTSGKILLEGAELEKTRSKSTRKAIQYIFQEPFSSLNPSLTVKKILSEPLQLYFNLSKKEIATRVGELLTEVWLDQEIQAAYPRSLSGGQCQRIAIARALAAEPEIMICDEPTSALDMTIQKQILDLFQKIQQERKISYLFIAHSLDVIYQLADHILVMNEGKVIEYGSKETIFFTPKDNYTKALIAAVPTIELPIYN